jgi:hypothetical protein
MRKRTPWAIGIGIAAILLGILTPVSGRPDALVIFD